MNPSNLKYISLLTLTVQNCMVSLSMRYARTRDGPIFFSSTGMSIKISLLTNYLISSVTSCSRIYGGNNKAIDLYGACVHGRGHDAAIQS